MSEHYFKTPEGADVRREVTVDAWGRELVLESSSGVFSHRGLDKATEILLSHVDPPADGGTLLDVGCGWGPIACSLAAAAPAAEVWAIDVNDRALTLTAENALRCGLSVRTSRPDDVPVGLRFDAIWSNPPIRVGKPALHDLLRRWLARLTDDGVAHLVVGRNLGADSLQRWLTEHGWDTERVASEQGFRVLQARAVSAS